MGRAPEPSSTPAASRSGMGWLCDLQRKQREVGIAYLLALGLRRVVPSAFFGASRFTVLAMRTSVCDTDARGDVRWADAGDLDRLCDFGHPRAEIEARLARGDRACAHFSEEGLVAYVWFRKEVYCEPDLRTRFRLGPGQVWLYDAMVARDRRGEGLYPRVLVGAAELLRREGVGEILILVEDLNRNSLRAHVAAGAEPIDRISALRLPGVARVTGPSRSGSVSRWVGPGHWIDVDARRLVPPRTPGHA